MGCGSEAEKNAEEISFFIKSFGDIGLLRDQGFYSRSVRGNLVISSNYRDGVLGSA